MIARPDLPRPLAFLIAGGATASPIGNITVQDITAELSTWVFPQPLPPLNLIAVLVGGKPGTVYPTKFQVRGPSETVIGACNGSDIPFTTQIFRVNLLQQIQQISAEPIVTTEGTYNFDLIIQGEVIATTPLLIRRIPLPSTAQPGGPQR
jgi:hypothetical protein